MNDAIIEISLEQLRESPFNPRKSFDDADLHELAANIKTEGRILQPLLVRPIVDADDFELVFGHRRLRGAAIAGLATVPCMVRAMTDAEVKRAQISENLQRKDVHPLEEAAGFRVLIDEHGETADTIAEQVGKARSYVYGRLQLLQLHPEVLKAMQDGEVGADVALLLARLRLPKLQARALGYIKGKYWDLGDGGKKSVRSIRALLNERFTLKLKGAPFPTDDETLVALAGTCGDCPKRSGNAPHFDDVTHAAGKNEDGYHHWTRHGGPDVCTDPDCFQAKKTAQQQREADQLRFKGREVITGAKARQIVGADGSVKGGYIALKDVKAELAKLKPKGKQAAAAAMPAPKVVTIQNPRDGKTVDVVKIEDLAAAGVKVAQAKHDARSNDWEAQQRRQEQSRQAKEAKAKVELQRRLVVLDQTLAAAAAQPRTALELLWMALQVFNGCDWDVRELLAKRHGFAKGDQLEKVLGQWPPERLGLFAVECALLDDAKVDAWADRHAEPKLLYAAAKHYGVDVNAIPAGQGSDTPSPAARAEKKAKGTKAGGRAAAGGKKAPGETGSAGQEQMDDAGCAGGSDAPVGDEAEEVGAL